MITGKDIYSVVAATVPLYVAMFLAYGSVRWWKIFTPEQCFGINRFVAVFAVPLLSFHFISSNNPYAMNYRFLVADSLQKVVILCALFAWQALSKRGSLEWMITLFSLSTLPNTLVMGIPLLQAMYGDFSGSLMVQIVVLQSVIWYTLMLFLFEYRGAKLLISEQFPSTAASITSLKVDSDIISLNGRDRLQADAEIGDDGKLRVRVKRSNDHSVVSSFKSHGLHSLNSMSPRASNLTGVEIYSMQSSREPTPRHSSFNQTDFYAMHSSNPVSSPKHGGDVFSLQSSKAATPRESNFDEEMMKLDRKKGGRSLRNGEAFHCELTGGTSSSNASAWKTSGCRRSGGAGSNMELHMFVWSSSASPISEPNKKSGMGGAVAPEFIDSLKTGHSHFSTKEMNNQTSGGDMEEGATQKDEELEGEGDSEKKHKMPPASVLSRLILIMVWRKLIRNPNTYSSLLGVVWSLISFRWNIQMPAIIKGSISILSDAGLGMAMFSLGLFMALQPKIIACGKSKAVFAMAVRFITGPAVIATTSIAIGLRRDLLQIAIVQAALPQGIVPFVFAKEYDVHPDILSTGVIFGMLIALPITILYYVLLGL